MAFDLNLPIRAVQFLFAVISLGLNGYGMYDPTPSPPLFLFFSFKPDFYFVPLSLPPCLWLCTPTYQYPHHTVAHQFDKFYFNGDAPSEVSFIVFVSVWTMVVTIYLLLAPLKFPKLAPVIAVLVLDALTMVFWFAAFIALAVWKSDVGECSGRICNTVVAGIVFGAFEWWVFPSHGKNAPLFFCLPKRLC